MWVSRREWDALQEKIDILREQLEHEQLKQQLTSGDPVRSRSFQGYPVPPDQLRQWKRMRDERDAATEAGL